MKLVSFVIPCYRSELTIGKVVAEIESTMAQCSGYDYEIVLVNDSSPDDTFGAIKKLVESDDRITGIDLARNFGQHGALMAGYHACKGDYVVSLDDDGQSPADEVPKLLAKLDEGYDVVYASYEHKQHSGFRNWGSKVNSEMTHIMLGKPRDLQITSYYAAKRFIIDEMMRYEGSYPYVIGLVLRSTKNICNVPVTHRQRDVGGSGYTLRKLIALWMNGFTSFSVKPLRMSVVLGIVSAALGFLYFLYIVIGYFVSGGSPAGWRSIMAVMLILGGVILVVLGLIGEYIGRIYMCENAAPQYVVREIAHGRKEER